MGVDNHPPKELERAALDHPYRFLGSGDHIFQHLQIVANDVLAEINKFIAWLNRDGGDVPNVELEPNTSFCIAGLNKDDAVMATVYEYEDIYPVYPAEPLDLVDKAAAYSKFRFQEPEGLPALDLLYQYLKGEVGPQQDPLFRCTSAIESFLMVLAHFTPAFQAGGKPLEPRSIRNNRRLPNLLRLSSNPADIDIDEVTNNSVERFEMLLRKVNLIAEIRNLAAHHARVTYRPFAFAALPEIAEQFIIFIANNIVHSYIKAMMDNNERSIEQLEVLAALFTYPVPFGERGAEGGTRHLFKVHQCPNLLRDLDRLRSQYPWDQARHIIDAQPGQDFYYGMMLLLTGQLDDDTGYAWRNSHIGRQRNPLAPHQNAPRNPR